MATTKKGGTKGAAKKAATSISGGTLTLRSSPKAKFLNIAFDLEKEFARGGCPGCRSGISRIVFQDPVAKNVK
ncbi:MAG: hypothetical protein V7641_2150 [Blastocatellia bacterium]